MKKFIGIIFLGISFPLFLYAQENPSVFSEKQFLWYVENYHPLSIRGELLIKQGESNLRRARGAFDPSLFGNYDEKYFDDKSYYSLLGSGLKIPTWFGIEVTTGYQQNEGIFLNPENFVPTDGLWYAGFSMPLGQGLFLDKRRAALGKAKIFAESTEAEKQKLINDLFFDALKDYWKWVEIWNKYKIYDESLVLAKTRFAAVKQSFLLGDKPAIDTLESFIQVQNLQMNLNEFELLYQNATLELSNYLWFENNLPLEITNGLHPPLISELNPVLNPTGIISDSIYSINFSHPDLKLYQYKLSSMDIEKRLMAEYLKPKINLQYKTLNQPGINSSLNAIPFQNYSWGLEFGFPLFLRQQRGDLQLTKLAINEIELQFQQKQLELQNKIKSYFNEIRILENQIALFTDAVGNYNKMLQGEKQKFDLGESSLFLINSREMSLIQANLKLIELKSKYRISHAGIKWAMGTLYLY